MVHGIAEIARDAAVAVHGVHVKVAVHGVIAATTVNVKTQVVVVLANLVIGAHAKVAVHGVRVATMDHVKT